MTKKVTLAACLAAMMLLATAPTPGSASPKSRYIVVLKEEASPNQVAAEHSRRHQAEVTNIYEHAIKGYAASIAPTELGAIRSDPRVAYVEADGVATASTTQASAVWGLDRIDQRLLPLSGSFSYTNTGTLVKVYVIDTGIRSTHSEFATNRVQPGRDFVNNDLDASDCHGHGTHVAGTVGGVTYGVAKDVSLVPVRVLDCNGSGFWSWVIAGIDWVTAEHVAGAPAVANMSLGGGANTAVDDAVKKSITDGVSYSIAAGNDNRSACNYSPARVEPAMTVAASDSEDKKASFSNYGSCVDWYSPGVGVKSAYKDSDVSTAVWSGTSMAAPHTAGVAALYLQATPTASPLTVANWISTNSSKGLIRESRRVYKNLLFTNL